MKTKRSLKSPHPPFHISIRAAFADLRDAPTNLDLAKQDFEALLRLLARTAIPKAHREIRRAIRRTAMFLKVSLDNKFVAAALEHLIDEEHIATKNRTRIQAKTTAGNAEEIPHGGFMAGCGARMSEIEGVSGSAPNPVDPGLIASGAGLPPDEAMFDSVRG
jgi:hypothetical protein